MKDAWGRTIEYVRLSLTDACNFCCPYCRPAEITPQSQTQLLSVDEWMTILGAFHHIGVKAVRLTGGEPLLYPHIEELLGRIKESGWFEDISMTTNGSLLASRAQRLKKFGLNRVNISLDSLETEAFATCVGKTGQLESVLDGIRSAINANFKSVKINTVLSRYWSDDEVKSLLQYVEKWPVVWRFIEYMPFQGDAFHGPTFDEGQMRLCLLRDDEGDLVSLVRNGASEEALAKHIERALQRKQERHDGIGMEQPERPMWRIGG